MGDDTIHAANRRQLRGLAVLVDTPAGRARPSDLDYDRALNAWDDWHAAPRNAVIVAAP